MEKEKISEGNKIIKKYMGYTYSEKFPLFNAYDENWTMLMSVIQKIINHKYEDGDAAYLRTFGMIDSETGMYMVRFNRQQLFMEESLIMATWQAVVDFIISLTPSK